MPIKCLRKKYNLKQSDLGNAGQVSQVEKRKRQVTASILLYLNTQTDSDYKEIIFGDIAKFVENMFYHCFSSILFRDLESVDKRMYTYAELAPQRKLEAVGIYLDKIAELTQ